MQHVIPIVRIPAITRLEQTAALGVVTINGCTLVVNRNQWNEGDRALLVEPDYVIPAGAPWSGLSGKDAAKPFRVRVARMCGVYSQGLLIPCEAPGLDLAAYPDGSDVMTLLGITRYVPPVETLGAEDAPAPHIPGITEYNLESWGKY